MTARLMKLERVRKYLADIPANAHPSDIRISVLVAIAGMDDLIRQEKGLPIDLPPVSDFAARVRQLSQDMSAAVALTKQIRNGVVS